MIIGQAAGVAAAMSIRESKAVQDVDAQKLTERLVAQGAVVEYRPPATSPAFFNQLLHKFHSEETSVRRQP